MTFVGSLSLSALMVPLFALFANVLFALSLQLTALIKLSLALGVSIVLPTIAVSLALVANLVIQFNIALGLTLPSFALNFAVAIDFELTLVLGLLASLEAQIAAIVDASIIAYGWVGPSSALGPALTAVTNPWADGTAGTADVTAYLFVATTSGGYGPDQVASLGMMPQPDPPPEPQNPPPPDGAYPPPQAYERGLVGLKISPPPEGGIQATGTVVTDDSISTGIGAVIAVAIDDHGSGYTSPPTVEVTDTVSIVAIAAGTPVTLTLPAALDVPVGDGFGVTVADVEPDTLNGTYCAKVATSTTIELYEDPDFTVPVSGSGTGGTVTGCGAGAAVLVTMGGGASNALKSLLDGLPWPTSTGLAGGVITFRAMLATLFSLMLDLGDNLTLRANLLGSIKLGVDFLPPSISASLELLARISANLSANLNVKLPSLSAAMAASLDAQIDAVAGLVARIGFFLGLGVDSAGVSLEIWEYRGPGSKLGTAIAQGPGANGWHDATPASVPVTVAVFGLTNTASATAFGALFTGA